MKKKKFKKRKTTSLGNLSQKEVRRYLAEIGIERLTDKGATDKFISQADGGLEKSLRYMLTALMYFRVPVVNMPNYYDIFQSMPGNFDYRLNFLPHLDHNHFLRSPEEHQHNPNYSQNGNL